MTATAEGAAAEGAAAEGAVAEEATASEKVVNVASNSKQRKVPQTKTAATQIKLLESGQRQQQLGVGGVAEEFSMNPKIKNFSSSQ